MTNSAVRLGLYYLEVLGSRDMFEELRIWGGGGRGGREGFFCFVADSERNLIFVDEINKSNKIQSPLTLLFPLPADMCI